MSLLVGEHAPLVAHFRAAEEGYSLYRSGFLSLAKETMAQATAEIRTHIEEMQSSTASALDGMQGIGAVIDRLHGVSRSIAGAIEQQNAAVSELVGL